MKLSKPWKHGQAEASFLGPVPTSGAGKFVQAVSALVDEPLILLNSAQRYDKELDNVQIFEWYLYRKL